MVTLLFQNFAVCRDAAHHAGLSATAELLVGALDGILCVLICC